MNGCLPVRRSDKFKEGQGQNRRGDSGEGRERKGDCTRTMCDLHVSCAGYLTIPAHLSPESNIH